MQIRKAPMLTLARKGEGRREIPLSQVEVPDVWHVAQHLMGSDDPKLQSAGEMVREVQRLAYDLLSQLRVDHGLDKD